MRLLFVCTGNICRSPAAAIVARSVLRADRFFSVTSAGTAAVAGSGVHPSTAEALQRRGLDPSGHVAQELTKSLIDEADVVLTMSLRQRSLVVTMSPQALRRTFTLREFARVAAATEGEEHDPAELVWTAVKLRGMLRGEDDVTDPMRSSSPGHDATVSVISELVGVVQHRFVVAMHG